MSERPDPQGPNPQGHEAPLLPGSALPDAVQTHLRRSLEVLRDQATDPDVRRRMDDVLAGRGSLRELATDGGFSAMMEPLVRRGLQRMDEMSPEEQAAARAGGEALGRGEVPEELRDDVEDGTAREGGTW